MENEPSTIGFEDGAIDFGHLLLEHKDGHVSLDSVMEMGHISRDFGVSISNTGFERERERVLNRDVLDSVRNEVEVGYFRLQNECCSMGGDYFLGFGFNESITNLDYGSNEGLMTSVPDSSILTSKCSPCKADIFRTMDTSDFGEVPSLWHEVEALYEQQSPNSPTSCNLQDTEKFHDILPYGNVSDPSPLVKMFCNPKNEKNDGYGSTGQNVRSKRLIPTTNHKGCDWDHLPTQKRSRKPTQRYIDEIMDPISRYPKGRREVSCLDQKKRCLGSWCMELPAEESSVVAIQVPFDYIVRKQCPKNPACEMVRSSDKGSNPTMKSEDNIVTRHNQKRRNECTIALHLKKRNYHNLRSLSQKKRDHIGSTTRVKKWSDRTTAPCLKIVTRKIRDDDCPTEESFLRKRKNRLWTIAEVEKLIDGVSECGVGKWSRIKKLSFPAPSHRTSVHLKDKWRNLLKVSRLQLSNQQGEKKSNIVWRSLPKSILRRVRELAIMYPYPKR